MKHEELLAYKLTVKYVRVWVWLFFFCLFGLGFFCKDPEERAGLLEKQLCNTAGMFLGNPLGKKCEKYL